VGQLNLKKLVIKDETNRFIFALCQFHEESKGSLCINRVQNKTKPKGYWYCFGCRAHGEITPEEVDSIVVESGAAALPTENVDLEVLQHEYWTREFQEDHAVNLAYRWNVDVKYLHEIGVGWDGQAWTIPFYNADYRIVGIQRRFPNGFRCAVSGGTLGLLIPTTLASSNELVVCEGASDLVTALQLGFQGIAKPNALVGKELVYDWLAKHRPMWQKIVIIADNDEAGLNGAQETQRHIDSEGKRSDIYIPFKKDFREDVELFGADHVRRHVEDLFGLEY
jgi:hypothetical protein